MAVPFACNRQISWISPHRFDLSNRLETAGSVASSGRAPRSLVDSYQTSASLRGGRSRSIGRKCQVHVTRVNEGCEWDEALSRMLHFPLRAAAKCGYCRKKKDCVYACVLVCVCVSLFSLLCVHVCVGERRQCLQVIGQRQGVVVDVTALSLALRQKAISVISSRNSLAHHG